MTTFSPATNIYAAIAAGPTDAERDQLAAALDAEARAAQAVTAAIRAAAARYPVVAAAIGEAK